jgi:uncharacterized protein YPO0396
MKAGYRLHRVELRNWGTFHGDKHYLLELNGQSTCFTGLNQSGKSTAMDAILTLIVPHEFRHYNVAATMNEAKRERSIRTYIMGAYSKGQSAETPSGRTLFLREKPGTLSIILAVFKDEIFGRSLTVAQIHWMTPSGEHQGRYLVKEADVRIPDLGIANVDVHGFAAHFTRNNWFYDPSPSAYYGKIVGILRVPSLEALRLFCRAVSLKDVQDVTSFVRTLMLQPQNPAAFLDGIVEHFTNLDHIHTELQATKDEIRLLKPVEESYVKYKEAADEYERLALVRRTLQIVLDLEAGGLLDAEIESLVDRKQAHDDEAGRLKLQLEAIEKRIVDINVSLRTNDTYAAMQSLKEEQKRLTAELAVARIARANLEIWLRALSYEEPVSTQAGFARLQKHAGTMLANEEQRHREALEARGGAIHEAKTMRENRMKLAEDINEMSSKRTKIPRHMREMRDEICQALGINEGLLPFVGELIDVSEADKPWRRTIEVLLNNFALSVVVPDDLYSTVVGYVEHSDFRSRFTYYRAPRGTGASMTLDATRVYGKLQVRPDAWCRGWLMQVLLRSYDHRCCERIEDFKAERGNAITQNLHVKGGERSFKEARRRLEAGDYDILGWTNEAKIADLKKRLNDIDAALKSKEDAIGKMLESAKGISGGIGLVRQITALSSFRAIDTATIETELTTTADRITELESSDSKLRELTGALKEAETEKVSVAGLRDVEVGNANKVEVQLEQRRRERGDIAKRFNQMSGDFDWRLYEEQALEFRGSEPLLISGELRRQMETHLNRVDVRSNQASRARENAKLELGPLMQKFLSDTAQKGKGYHLNWSATVESAPAMVEHLHKLEDERFHVQEAEFKKEMDRLLEEDIDLTKAGLANQQKANADRIKEVNAKLHPISYNEGTFVKIEHQSSPDQAVAKFRVLLDNCTKHVMTMTPELRLERFKAIKELITYIKEHRTDAIKGANPNNWDVYAVAERRRENPEIVAQWHGDSDGGSGGQKAKLACTVVAAALSFRMEHSGKKDSTAFRLVMVDEIFQKSDDENSAYALKIFEQFDLQLLLATPRDGRLKLVIPYVGSFHLFQNPTKASSSVVSITAEQARTSVTADSDDADAG